MSKYRNIKVELSGIKFDSLKEARRYSELKLLERAGEIKDLQLQKKFILVPAQYQRTSEQYKKGRKKGQYKEKLVEKELAYKADFVYTDNRTGETIVEDVKGFKTKEYRIKKKLMLYLLGIRISEV